MRALALVWIACCGCSAPGSSAGPARVMSEAELPQREREAWERYHAGGAAWELERERVLAEPDLLRFVVDNLVRELVRSYDRSRIARAGERAGPFERARQELVRFGPHATPVLAGLLAVGDGVVAFLAADLLLEIGTPALGPVRQLLQQPETDVRRRACELLGRLPHAGAEEAGLQEELGARVRDDAAWLVRGQAARALGARGARHSHKGYAAGVLARSLSDPDPTVVESAARALRELGEPRALPFLIDALERSVARGDLHGVRAAQASLQALSGQTRDRSAAEWREWWTRHGESERLPH